MAEKGKKQEAKQGQEHDHSQEGNNRIDEGHNHEQEGHDHSAEENLQAKYYEFQIINEQMKQLQQQDAAIDEQNAELQLTLQGLTDLGNTKEGSRIMVPISSGIFAEAELKDKTNLLVSAGNNIIVRKTLSKTIGMIEERIAAVEIYKAEIDQNLAAHMKRAKELEAELNSILKNLRG